jgi:prevent-host-death family protein
MATQVNIHEAKTHFSKLIAKVVAGEEVTIAKAGKAVARLVPAEEPTLAPRPFGIDKGKIWMSDDCFDPMTEEELKEWYDGGPDDPLNW